MLQRDSSNPVPLSDTLLRACFAQSADAFVVYDPELRLLELNAAGAAFLSIPAAQAIGSTLTELQRSDAGAPPHLTELIAAVEHALSTAAPFTTAHRVPTSPAQTIVYETTYTPILDAAGQPTCVLSVGRPQSAPPIPLQQVIDHLPQYLFWKDCNSVYLGCNRKWADMSGVGSPEQVIGKSDHDLPWTPEEAAYYLECDRLVIESGIAEFNTQESQRQADGKHTWRDCRKVPIRDASGAVIGILGTLEDITERKRAETRLQASEARFRELAQRERLLNHLASQIRNSLDLNTILETTVTEVRSLLNVDRCNFVWYCPDTQPPYFDLVHEARSPRLPSVLGQYPIEAPDHAYLRTLLSFQIVQADDLATDTSLDPHTRQRLRSHGYRSHISCPVQTLSGKLGIVTCAHCSEVRVWQPEEVELLQAVANQLAIALDQADLYNQSRTAARLAQAQAQQLEQALRDLQCTQLQLIQTEKMSSLGQLVAGVAHEINNPVNFIYGNLTYTHNYTQTLLRLLQLYQQHYPANSQIQAEAEAADLDFIVSDLPRMLNSMRVGAERIRQIVLSLRNFSRLDEAEKKPIDIHEGIDSTLLILQNRIKPKPHCPAIEVVKAYGKLPLIECYVGQLNQVFMNILSNAIDALEESVAKGHTTAPKIHIATEVLSTAPNGTTPPDDRIIIRIADNGMGIPPDVTHRLFDPFFTTKPIGAGTGLGLSISHQIVVEKHGGELKCRSTLKQGTEFCIEIPVRQNRYLGNQ